MNQQFTPTYHRMWNRDFTLLIAAELLICMACYMTIPFLPYRLFWTKHIDSQWASLTMVMFVAGICMSGFFGCWLIQRYRRNKVFFISALCLGGTILAMSLFDNSNGKNVSQGHMYALIALCTFGGIVFGHAKRVLSCTLLIDKTESCHRTEANYAAIWIARLTIVVGPVMALALRDELGNTWFYGVGAAAALLSAALVMTVKFPFRAPEENTHFISIDRFFLSQGWNVAIVIALMGGALGILIGTHMSTDFFVSLMFGFAIAIIILHYNVVRTGRYTSLVGNVCILAAMTAMILHNGLLDDTLKPMILGMGFGLTSSEQLYKLLDCCNHCQRSTAESTYFFASDGGLFLGIATGWGCDWGLYGSASSGEQCATALFAAATVVCCLNALVKKKRKEYHA